MFKLPYRSRAVLTDTASVFPVSNDGVPVLSAADLTERQLVTWLMTSSGLESTMIEELQLPPASKSKLWVTSPFVRPDHQAPGDIDALFASDPKQATVIEWKRVKIVQSEGVEQNINRLGALKACGKQVRAVRALGFWQSFLGIVAVVDGRASSGPNFAFRGASNRTYDQILAAVWEAELPEDVGIFIVEVCQPIQKNVYEAHSVSISLIRKAKAIDQVGELSEKVERHFL